MTHRRDPHYAIRIRATAFLPRRKFHGHADRRHRNGDHFGHIDHRDTAAGAGAAAIGSFHDHAGVRETFAASSSESKQHQAFAEAVETFAVLYPRLPPARQPRAEDAMRRILACGDGQLPTPQIHEALAHLVETLERCQRFRTAHEVGDVRDRLNRSLGGNADD